MGKKLGRVKEILGYATGDRDVEARGRVEQRVADPADPTREVNDRAIAREKSRVSSELDKVDSDGGQEPTYRRAPRVDRW
jgi:uncharacterized protein YjbJ (UPF0337 family)